MNLRHRVILIYLAATLVPMAALLWMSERLLEHSLSYVVTDDLDQLSRSLESVAREYYQLVRNELWRESVSGDENAQKLPAADRNRWPAAYRQFWDTADKDRFVLSEPEGDHLNYLVRRGDELWIYSRNLGGLRMQQLTQQYRQARAQVELARRRDLRRGFTYTLVLLGVAIWGSALALAIWLANRFSRPVQDLTAGLRELAAGNLQIRLNREGRDEVGRAIAAFNHTAEQLRASRDRLIYLTQVASWQTLARKMAHELKNSLTPIRLTVEEIVARQPSPDRPFLEQAAQVVVDEVESLQRRLRAFSEFAAEPTANPALLDVNALLKERIEFLLVAHPDISYNVELAAESPAAWADCDQVKGILTNLLENGAEAAGSGGRVLGKTSISDGYVVVEVHDSGPGLSLQARTSLFEPAVSFKKNGMGLGLSISRKNALLAGGDLQTIEGCLGGAGFRLTLPAGSRAD